MSPLKYYSPPDTYYDIDVRGYRETFDIDKDDDTVYIDGKLVQSGNGKGYVLYLSFLNGEYAPHREDGPACIGHDGEAWFIYNGVNYGINEFPVDEVTKVMWLLKYEICERDYYITYHSER